MVRFSKQIHSFYRNIRIFFIITTLIFSAMEIKNKEISSNSGSDRFNIFLKDFDLYNTRTYNFENNKFHNKSKNDTDILQELFERDFIFLQITKEGHLKAYNQIRRDIIWEIDLGSPLITSHIDIENHNIEDLKVLPGTDGFIYHTDLNSNIIERIDVNIENLIDRSPFTLPMMSDTIFLGDKLSTVYNINIKTGLVISKISSNFTTPTPYIDQFQNFENNFITIVRTDFIIRCYKNGIEESKFIWNMTVSEVAAIRDGVTVLNEDKEEKIYLLKRKGKWIESTNEINTNDRKIENHNISPNCKNWVQPNFTKNQKNKISEYPPFKNYPTSYSENKSIDPNLDAQYLNIYTILIFFLICVCTIAVYFYFEIYKKNLELKNQIKLLKKESQDNMSAKSTKVTNEKSNNNFELTQEQRAYPTKQNNISFKNKKVFPKIKNNFEEDYDCDEENLTDNEISVSEDYLENLEVKSEINSVEFKKMEISEKAKNQNRKVSTTAIEEKSLNSVFSLNSKNSNKSLKTEKIYSEEDFKNKSKLPILNENFPLNYQISDVSSVADCIIEEDQEHIKKTEVRKLVTIYKKHTQKSDNNQIATQFENSFTSLARSDFKNSIRINVNAKLTKENFHIALEKEDQEENRIRNSNACDELKIMKSEDSNKSGEKVIEGSNCNKLQKIFSGDIETLILNNQKSFDEGSNKNNPMKLSHYRKQSQEHLDLESFTHELNSTVKEKYEKELCQLEEMYVNETLKKYSRINLNQSISDKQSQFWKILDELSQSESDGENSYDETFKSLNVSEDYYYNNFDTGRFLRNFENISIIGKGGFGCVFKAKHKIDSSEYAVKIIQLKIKLNESLADLEVVKEIKTMMKLETKYVVRYVTCWFELSGDRLKIYQQQKKIRSRSSNWDLRLKNSPKEIDGDTYADNVGKINENVGVKNQRLKKTSYKFRSSGNKDFKESSLSDSNGNEDFYFDSEKYKYSDVYFINNNNSNDNNNNKANDSFSKPERNDLMSRDDFDRNNDTNHMHIKQNEHSANFARTKSHTEMLSVYFFMQMEYCKGFPLSFYLENRKTETDRNLIYIIFKQILLGVVHIHEHNIIHRDLKPANILIHDYLCVKIADFGLATDKNKNPHNESELKENVGTPLYQSPEQVKGLPYNEKVDIYSLGIILLELCIMFKTQSERRAVLENTRLTGHLPEKIKTNYPNEYNLIKMMVDGQPLKRPSAKEILSSPDLKKIASKYDFEENHNSDI